MARTLVVERHDWETSGSGHQIQFPKAAFRQFFRTPGSYRFRIFDPPWRKRPARETIAKVSQYRKSATYRLNRILEIGGIKRGFVLIEKIIMDEGKPTYDIWWFTGSAAKKIEARRWDWRRAKASQYGPGRRWTILGRSGPRRASD